MLAFFNNSKTVSFPISFPLNWEGKIDFRDFIISDIVYQLVCSQNQSNSNTLALKNEDINVLINKIDAAELFTNQILYIFNFFF